MKKMKLGFFIAVMLFAIPKTYAQLGDFGGAMSALAAPPPMPIYDQPLCPTDGNQWQPGYWAYDSGLSDFYFVPGTWVIPPQPGLLWTPPYWGYENGLYGFHPGYWGTDVGFYGGIDYGFGYFGLGFSGGKWKGHHFHYNTAVTHVNTTVVHDTYVDNTVIVNNNVNVHVSFNGPGGITIKPRPEEIRVINETHIQPTSAQIEYQRSASVDRNQFAKNNYGRPTTTAVNRANSYHPQVSVPHTNGHVGSTAARTSSAGRHQGSTAHGNTHTRNTTGGQQHHANQSGAHTRNSSGGQQHRANQSSAHTRNNSGGQQHHASQSSTQHRVSQNRSSQYSRQHTSQQQTPQKTQQPRTQQPRLPQQQHVQQPRVQQQQPKVQPRKTTH